MKEILAKLASKTDIVDVQLNKEGGWKVNVDVISNTKVQVLDDSLEIVESTTGTVLFDFN